MNKKNLTPKNVQPVIRKSSVSLPELHEEQLTGGIADSTSGIAMLRGEVCACICSFEGDDA